MCSRHRGSIESATDFAMPPKAVHFACGPFPLCSKGAVCCQRKPPASRAMPAVCFCEPTRCEVNPLKPARQPIGRQMNCIPPKPCLAISGRILVSELGAAALGERKRGNGMALRSSAPSAPTGRPAHYPLPGQCWHTSAGTALRSI